MGGIMQMTRFDVCSERGLGLVWHSEGRQLTEIPAHGHAREVDAHIPFWWRKIALLSAVMFGTPRYVDII